ncbi:MAG: hypothetical protein F4Z15_00500 [Gammaproteobacteria bacterium]|nr:hypothetical protein [Gammaproteobacteria bacterium]MYD77279.1 hypothetical protein [Gammaproteobacteria bacterium]MYJ52047.1 hypothetical protein [Gammaproteobacteria bacterium]
MGRKIDVAAFSKAGMTQPDPLTDGYDKVREYIRHQDLLEARPKVRRCRACEKPFEPRRRDHHFCTKSCCHAFHGALRKLRRAGEIE